MMVFLLILSLYFIIIALREKNEMYEIKEKDQVDNGIVKQILSMPNQSGGDLSQGKIRENLNVNPEKVINVLNDLEKE